MASCYSTHLFVSHGSRPRLQVGGSREERRVGWRGRATHRPSSWCCGSCRAVRPAAPAAGAGEEEGGGWVAAAAVGGGGGGADCPACWGGRESSGRGRRAAWASRCWPS